jgi:hypothetical protein
VANPSEWLPDQENEMHKTNKKKWYNTSSIATNHMVRNKKKTGS